MSAAEAAIEDLGQVPAIANQDIQKRAQKLVFNVQRKARKDILHLLPALAGYAKIPDVDQSSTHKKSRMRRELNSGQEITTG